MMRELEENGHINVSWADGIPYSIFFGEKAYEYEEKEFRKIDIENSSYNVANGNIYINSTDNSNHITNLNSDINELFEEMKEIASKLQSDNKDQIHSVVYLSHLTEIALIKYSLFYF